MREQLFKLPDKGRGALQMQVREMLVATILGGQIPPGRALPSCRKLAVQLGVARNTVVMAYQHLVDEGYLEARERSGYYVAQDVLETHAQAESSPDGLGPTGSEVDESHWLERLRVAPSGFPSPSRPRDWQSYRYPFVYGQVDPTLFPINDWRECARRALGVDAIREWTNDSVDADDTNLIEQLQTRVLPRRGVWAQQDEILVTLGAQQALYILARLLVDGTTRVGIENPGYADARNILEMHAGSVTPLPVDADGLMVGETLGECDYVYVTPSHQCPTTVTMPLARRHELLEVAASKDIIYIEDDYEAETNYYGAPTPALKSLDRDDRVIYVGSLSKTLAPGLRLGFMVAPRAIIREARALRRFMVRHPPANNARAAALFLAVGHHDSLVRKLRHVYMARRNVLAAAMEEHLPGMTIAPGFGGTSFWVRGPDDLDVRELGARAARESILVERGDVHFAGPAPPRNYFRLGFSSIAVEHIEPGIKKLAALINAR
jgi:GntR family transcriptional regulator / MocR family aminotransferase